MEVYTAVYDGISGDELIPTEAKVLDENSFEELKDKKVLFVGDGALKAKEILQLPNAEFNTEIYPSAQYLINKTLEK